MDDFNFINYLKNLSTGKTKPALTNIVLFAKTRMSGLLI